MNQENPNKLKDDVSFYLILSLFSSIIILLMLYKKEFIFTTLALLVLIIFIIKTEFSLMRRKSNKHFDEIRKQLQYIERKIK